VAKAQGKSVDGLKAALKADETTRLDQAVKAGRLTTDQRTKLEAALDQRLDAEVDGTPPAGPGGPGHRPHFRWP
jgi:hypothetical protein